MAAIDLDIQVEEHLLNLQRKAKSTAFGDTNIFLNECSELQDQLEKELFNVERNLYNNEEGLARFVKFSENVKTEIKRNRDCVNYLRNITSLEDDISDTSTRVLQKVHNLTKVSQSDKVSGELVMDCWHQISRASEFAQLHAKNAADYHLFFYNYRDITLKLKERWLQLTHWFEEFSSGSRGVLREADSIKTFLNAQLSEFLYLRQRVDDIVTKSRTIVPVLQRLQPVKEPRSAILLGPYKTRQGSFHEGQEILLMDNTDARNWRVSCHLNGSYVEFDVPSLLVWIPPPNISTTELALKLEDKFLTLWGSSVRQFQLVISEYLTVLFKHLSAHDYAQFENPQQWQCFTEDLLALFDQPGEKNYETLLYALDDLNSIKSNSVPSSSKKTLFLKETETVLLRALLEKLHSFSKYWEAFRQQSLMYKDLHFCFMDEKNDGSVCSAHVYNSMSLLELVNNN